MNEHLAKIKRGAQTFGRGLLLSQAPRITAGVVNKLFHDWQVTPDKLASDVDTNASLLDRITDEQLDKLQMALNTGVDFFEYLSADFVAQAIEMDFPAVATMIRTWDEAHTWMERQLDDLKSLFGH